MDEWHRISVDPDEQSTSSSTSTIIPSSSSVDYGRADTNSDLAKKMSSVNHPLLVTADESLRHLEVMFSSMKTFHDPSNLQAPRKSWSDPTSNRKARDTLFDASFEGILQSSSSIAVSHDEVDSYRTDYEQNLSISESYETFSKIELNRHGRELGAPPDLKHDSVMGKTANCLPAISKNVPSQTLSKTLDAALSICSRNATDPLLAKIDAMEAPCSLQGPSRPGVAPTHRDDGRRLHGINSSEDLQSRRCQRLNSRKWRRCSSGLSRMPSSIHSRRNRGDLLRHGSSRHSVFSDITFDSEGDDCSIHSFESGISSLGMGSFNIQLLPNALTEMDGQDDTVPHGRRNSREQSVCPSLDTALHGSGLSANALPSREDSVPRRPRRRRSQSPEAGRLRSETPGKSHKQLSRSATLPNLEF